MHSVLKNKVILIAEDEQTNYMYLEEVLTREGATVLHARNGIEAVEMAKDHDVNLILMDIKMPVSNGFEATKKIRKFKPDLPIIAQTAYALVGDEEKAIDAGCDDYLPKPIKKEVILEKIREFLR